MNVLVLLILQRLFLLLSISNVFAWGGFKARGYKTGFLRIFSEAYVML